MPVTELPSLYSDENDQGASKQKEEPINKTTINIVIESLLKYFFHCLNISFSAMSSQNSVSVLDSVYVTEVTDSSNPTSQDKSRLQRCIL